MLLGALKFVIKISSASLFSRIILFLSKVRVAVTPVISATLFSSVTKLLKSSGKIVAETETASLTPAAIDIEAVPLTTTSIGSKETLVTASAAIPVFEAFSLNSFKVNSEEELTGIDKVLSIIPSLKVSTLIVWAETGFELLDAECPVIKIKSDSTFVASMSIFL